MRGSERRSMAEWNNGSMFLIPMRGSEQMPGVTDLVIYGRF